MWVERVLRHGFDVGQVPGDRRVDYLDLNWDECGRVVRKNTRGGEPMRVLLPAGEAVRHGDVLRDDEAGLVVVKVLPCDVVVATPASLKLATELGLHLGNLHQPVQVADEGVVFLADPAAMALIERLQTPWTSQRRVFEPAVVATGHTPVQADQVQILRRSRTG